VEALPENFDLLVKNLQLNGFGWAHVLQAAASNRTGEATFFPAGDSGRNSLAQNGVTDGTPIRVQTILLDDIAIEFCMKKLDVLLVDVEGAENLVLQGAAGMISAGKVTTILCEFHPSRLVEDFETDPNEFLLSVLHQGYRITTIDPKTGTELPFEFADLHAYQHLVFRLADQA
jgi:FkbM family methyltransferase